MVEEVGQLLLAATQSLLEGLAFRHLGGERVRLLLELRNDLQALVGTRQRRVALRWDDVRVRRADGEELLGVCALIKATYGISTQQWEGVGLGEIVPERLEPERGGAVPCRPQECHHLPKGAHVRIPTPRADNDVPNDLGKALRLWPAVDHQLRQCLGRI